MRLKKKADWINYDAGDNRIVQVLNEAIQYQHKVSIEYSGSWRNISPFAWGSSKDGNVVLKAYTCSDSMESDDNGLAPKSYRVDKITNITPQPNESNDKGKYNQDYDAMTEYDDLQNKYDKNYGKDKYVATKLTDLRKTAESDKDWVDTHESRLKSIHLANSEYENYVEESEELGNEILDYDEWKDSQGYRDEYDPDNSSERYSIKEDKNIKANINSRLKKVASDEEEFGPDDVKLTKEVSGYPIGTVCTMMDLDGNKFVLQVNDDGHEITTTKNTFKRLDGQKFDFWG